MGLISVDAGCNQIDEGNGRDRNQNGMQSLPDEIAKRKVIESILGNQ